jgi:hypothetical protein
MKNFSVFLALSAVLFIFSACEKEDDFSVIGTWEQEKLQVTIDYGVPLLPNHSETITEPATIVFLENGTGTLTTEQNDQPVAMTFNWTLSKDVLTLKGTGIDLKLKLTTKSDTKMVGEQTLNTEEVIANLNQLLANINLSDEEKLALSLLTNLKVKVVFTLVREL